MAKPVEEKTPKAPEEKITTDGSIMLLIRLAFIIFDAVRRLFSLMNAGVMKKDLQSKHQLVSSIKQSDDKLKGMLKKELVDLVLAYEKETGIGHENVK